MPGGAYILLSKKRKAAEAWRAYQKCLENNPYEVCDAVFTQLPQPQKQAPPPTSKGGV